MSRWLQPVRSVVCLILAMGLVTLGSEVGAGQEERRAGLVVQFGDGSVQTYCLPLEGETATGLELLQRSGLPVLVEGYGGLGALVCKIGPDGCEYPQESCVCNSYGPGGVYWSYHHLEEGRWKASVRGADSYRVGAGAVEGWAWSSGSPPPVYTFEQICRAPQPLPTDTPPPPAPPTATPTATHTVAALPPTATLPQPTHTTTPVPTTRATATPTVSEVPAVPTGTRPSVPSVVATDTPQPPTATALPPVETATATLTLTASAATATPTSDTQASVTATATLPAQNRAESGTTREELARNISLGIGAAALGGLLVWWLAARRFGSGAAARGGGDVE